MNRNSVHLVGDITSDIYYTSLIRDGKVTPFLRLFMVVQGSSNQTPIPAIRLVFYGKRAQIVEAFVKKGTRLYIEGHIQTRVMKDGKTIFEIVCEFAEAMRYATWARGYERIEDLKRQDPNIVTECAALIDGMRNHEEEGSTAIDLDLPATPEPVAEYA